MTANISPLVWGPSGWNFLHYITLAYPDNPTEVEKNNYKTFFTNIKNVLPCELCRTNYAIHLNKFPLTNEILSDKTKFINWCITIHNQVNIANNKKPWTYTEVMNKYTKKSNKINLFNILKNKQFLFILLIILIIISLILYAKIISNPVQ